MEQLEGNEKRDAEERAKVEANFKELYGRALRKPAENMTINI